MFIVEFKTASGSVYRKDVEANTMECVSGRDPFPPRRIAEDTGIPMCDGIYAGMWEEPDDKGRRVLRTSRIVEVKMTGKV